MVFNHYDCHKVDQTQGEKNKAAHLVRVVNSLSDIELFLHVSPKLGSIILPRLVSHSHFGRLNNWNAVSLDMN